MSPPEGVTRRRTRRVQGTPETAPYTPLLLLLLHLSYAYIVSSSSSSSSSSSLLPLH